jgi:transitional endoplasmic reticulum ATPase
MPEGAVDDQNGENQDLVLSPQATLARVRLVLGERAYLEYSNGNAGWASREGGLQVAEGNVVLVSAAGLEVVPDEMWPEEEWIAVVRIKLDDVTVVDANGRWKLVPNNRKIEYAVGNTVLGRDRIGVTRFLQKEPIKYLDLPELDASVVERFKAGEKGGRETFDDFGGLHDVVARAKELLEVSLQHRERLTKIGARPVKGVLFTGPPGGGKTMLARIIANETKAKFYEISGPEVFSKWYGQSEELLRMLFEDAASQDGSIIFFDEIDSVAGHRDDDSHEASKRVVAQLLTLMDGFAPETNVVVIAATNRPQDIDRALLRPGRFDWEIEFSLPSRSDREEILEKTAKRHAIGDDLPHSFVAAHSEGWSGAELSGIWTEAALLAVTDERDAILREDYLGGFERVADRRKRRSAPAAGAEP